MLEDDSKESNKLINVMGDKQTAWCARELVWYPVNELLERGKVRLATHRQTQIHGFVWLGERFIVWVEIAHELFRVFYSRGTSAVFVSSLIRVGSHVILVRSGHGRVYFWLFLIFRCLVIRRDCSTDRCRTVYRFIWACSHLRWLELRYWLGNLR